MDRNLDRMNLVIFSALISVLLVSTITILSEETYAQNSELEVHFIDVKTGDAVLIKVLVEGQKKWILIDGGFDGRGESTIIPYLKEKGVRELEYVIATHYDGDHIGGLDEIVSEIAVKNLYGRGGSPIIERD
ncbi:MAG: MBL fold metallo-hydrolase, partial [Nitrososphaerales archaeon]